SKRLDRNSLVFPWQRVAANGRPRHPNAAAALGAPPLGRGGVSRDKGFSPSTPGSPPRVFQRGGVARVSWSRTGPVPNLTPANSGETLRASTLTATLSWHGSNAKRSARAFVATDVATDRRDSAHGFVGNLQRSIDDAEPLAQLRLRDTQRRIGEERVPADERVETFL